MPVHSVDPHRTQDYAGGQIIQQLYESPYKQDGADAPPVPVIFDGPLEREMLGGGRCRLVGRLRPGLRFSDGTELKAADVADSLGLAAPIASRARIEAAGDRVEFTLSEDDPRFEQALSRRWCSIVARRGQQIVGTGPYMVRAGWQPGEIVVERNPHARWQPHVDEVVFRAYPPTESGQPESLKQALAEGVVDFTTALGRDDLGAMTGVRKVFQPGSSTCLLAINVENPVLSNPEVRIAIAEAIDRTEIAALSYDNPHAFTARSLLPPSMWRKSDGLRYAPDRAKERIKRAGIDLGRPLRLVTMWGPRPYLPHPDRTIGALTKQLGEVGLVLEVVQTRDSVDYARRTEAGDYDLDLTGWIADTPDPYDFVKATLGSDSIPMPGKANSSANNLARYRSPEMDAALDRYRRDGASERLEEVVSLASRDVPVCPLFHGPTIIVHTWRLRNVEVSGTGIADFANVELD